MNRNMDIWNLDLSGGTMALSARLQQFIVYQQGLRDESADILIVSPKYLRDLKKQGGCFERDGVWYFIDEKC